MKPPVLIWMSVLLEQMSANQPITSYAPMMSQAITVSVCQPTTPRLRLLNVSMLMSVLMALLYVGTTHTALTKLMDMTACVTLVTLMMALATVWMSTNVTEIMTVMLALREVSVLTLSEDTTAHAR